MPHCMTVFEARSYFPRGLLQPPGSYRFAADSLLLAAFPGMGKNGKLLDIGTGCGVVALAALCQGLCSEAWGVEREPALVNAARENARRLGFERHFHTVEADITRINLFAQGLDLEEAALPAGDFGLVLANPPFRSPEKGRISQSPLRRNALFEDRDTLASFCAVAARALSPEGRFGVLYDAARRDFLLEKLTDAGLTPLRLLSVRALPGKTPFRILVEARLRRYIGDRRFREEELLTIHNSDGTLREEVLEFCPLLAVSI